MLTRIDATNRLANCATDHAGPVDNTLATAPVNWNAATLTLGGVAVVVLGAAPGRESSGEPNAPGASRSALVGLRLREPLAPAAGLVALPLLFELPPLLLVGGSPALESNRYESEGEGS